MDNIEIPIDTYSSIEISGERGYEIFEKIYEKSARYMEKYGREAKYVILDSESYLILYTHLTLRREGGMLSQESLSNIYTPAGPLTPIVLPQTSTRIQVIGDQMFTATRTMSENDG